MGIRRRLKESLARGAVNPQRSANTAAGWCFPSTLAANKTLLASLLCLVVLLVLATQRLARTPSLLAALHGRPHPTDPATRAAAEHAAALLEQADALIVATGAGMGWIPAALTFGATKGSGALTSLAGAAGLCLHRLTRSVSWGARTGLGLLRPPAGAITAASVPRALGNFAALGRAHAGVRRVHQQ